MKNLKLLHILLLLGVMMVLPHTQSCAQCIPLGPEECPDPENNGEICPDVLPEGFLNQSYSEEATILVPTKDPTGIDLHHFTLVAVENLPPGLSWVTNAPDNEFYAGNYYCLLLDGIPGVADTFYLKIVIDVYIDFNGQPVYGTQIVDSTSLSMVIKESNSIDDRIPGLRDIAVYPNPFNEQANINFFSSEAMELSFEVYSMIGQMLYSRSVMARPGSNTIKIDVNLPGNAPYCYVFRSGGRTFSALMVKSR